MFRWLVRAHARPTLAATVMTLLILTVVVAPFVIVGATLAENFDADQRPSCAGGIAARTAGPARLARAACRWSASASRAYWATLRARQRGNARGAAAASSSRCARRRLRGGAVVGEGLLQLTLSVFIAFFFFRDGDAIMARVRARRQPHRARARPAHARTWPARTTRAVVYGILGTALAQGVLMAIGLYIVGIKAAPLLGLADVLPVAGAGRTAAGVDSRRACG